MKVRIKNPQKRFVLVAGRKVKRIKGTFGGSWAERSQRSRWDDPPIIFVRESRGKRGVVSPLSGSLGDHEPSYARCAEEYLLLRKQEEMRELSQ